VAVVARRRADAGTPERCAYGPDPDQVADLYRPAGPTPTVGWPVVVLIHGGYWRERYRRDLMGPLAPAAVARGLAVYNLEYRRVGGAGGWPETLLDAAAGIDHLERLAGELDRDRVVVVGHSAGGHLALWLAGRQRLALPDPGAGPRVQPAAVVAQAPVADLRAADRAGLSAGAVRELLRGGPRAVPHRWEVADPVRGVGHGVPVLLVHGDEDTDVPVAQSEAYAAAASDAGDPVTFWQVAGDHFVVIDPHTPLWADTLTWIVDRIGVQSPAG
jgi:acetyl esterase/lipase